jgi:signal recognition particle receptor subunit beta
MDYYNSLIQLVHPYSGKALGDLISLDPAMALFVTHSLLLFTAAFAFTQILAIFSGANHSTAQAKATGGTTGGLNAALTKGAASKKKKRPNLLLLCGPTNSGKTALFYHLLTKEIRTTVTSIEINETPQGAPMAVKIPQTATQSEEATSKKLTVVDIPGHYHFKDRLNDTLDEAKAIIVVVDSKEKEKFGEAAEILYEILNNLTVLSERVPIVVACNK